MNILTTTTRNKPKSFAWSYSKLKNFESCPKRHWHCDIAKDVKEEESEQLMYGNMLHKALAERIGKGIALPKPYAFMEKWAEKILTSEGTVLVEQQLAITKELDACEWFSRDAWYRGIADVIKIKGPVALAIDWKTGKILEDGVQLALMAQCIFSHHPEVQKIRTEFVWTKEDASTRADFTREDMVKMWNSVSPRVALLESASVTTSYPPKPGNLCQRWCPVVQCPHNGV
jgi:hypothetical protein